MCDENIPRTCKQRFKGIETFLRRVAFNLGNTPSQTEVKIISCIPIDVTDLQQKIVSLERELHNARGGKASKESCPPNTTVNTTKCTGVYNTSLTTCDVSARSRTESKTKQNTKSQPDSSCNRGTNGKRSNISFVFSALSIAENKEGSDCVTSVERKQHSKGINLFRRKKKCCKESSRPNNHLVYYAEASHNPFINMYPSYLPSKATVTQRKDSLSEHLTRVMRKQYDPEIGIEEFSDTTEFSRPICKDMTNPIRYDTDVCSCCHGQFQNVGNYMDKNFNYISDQDQLRDIEYTHTNKIYYDSDLYDVVPVKEMSCKIKNDTYRKEENKKNVNINCWPESIRTKPRKFPTIVNYRAEIPNRYRYYRQTTHRNTFPRTLLSNTNRQRLSSINDNVTEGTSKSFSIECGNVYVKPATPLKVSKRNEFVLPPQQENEKIPVDTNISQVKESKSVQLGVNLINDTNTEVMLEQIKSILQSVLAEVKTNTQLTKEEIPKRDAVVQKGSSQNNMPGCSTLLHSLTYNTSRNANSFYAPYSLQIPPGPLCYASIPYQSAKCMQNLQYLLHPCHRHQTNPCNHCNNGHNPPHKPVNTAINTEAKTRHSTSKETNNLIKDIYKSVALNMNYPSKGSSKSGDEELRSCVGSTNKSHTRDGISTISSIHGSDVLKSDKEIEALLSSNTATTCPTHHYAESSSQYENKYVTQETTTGDMKRETNKNTQAFNLYRFEERTRRRSSRTEQPEESCDEESESNGSDDTMVKNEDDKITKQKKGLLHRFFKSVKLLRRRKVSRSEVRDAQEEEDETCEESDTEDYETYSESVQQSQYRFSTPVKPMKKAPSINIQLNGKRISRSPYMEQEERRQWNEMFHESPGRSGKLGASRSLRNKHTPYRKSYEVRSAAVDGGVRSDATRVERTCRGNHGNEKMSLIKKRKLGINCRCGERFKNLILEN